MTRAGATPAEWRDVCGYEGCYEVSSLGEVRSLSREVRSVSKSGKEYQRTLSPRALMLTADWGKHCYGRLTVKLSKEGRALTRLVHQLVAEAFIGPRPAGLQVAHRDGNPANNAVGNLRYATPAENTNDKVLHGTVLRGSEVGTAKLTENQVRLIRCRDLSVTRAAQAFGVSIAQVSRIRSGERWGHLS